jgi:DNA-binding CsgD family transcriptional regulator
MVSAQTYVNKGKALLELGQNDSVSYYISKARQFCESLPYNSGMVDIDLLEGIYLTNKGGDSMHLGMQKLLHVTREGTAINQAKAYHQLAQTYLKCGKGDMADIMLDNMYSLLSMGDFPTQISIDYDPIINHYLKNNNHSKVERYTRLMLQEQQAFKEKKLNFNLAEAIVDHKTAQDREILQIALHKQNNRSLWLLISVILSVMAISSVVTILLHQRKRHILQMKQADDKVAILVEKLNQSSAEKEMIVQEIDEMMNDKDNRQELETLTPSILQKYGESRFRQRFELLYPLFLPRLRERVPSISRREELLSMLIILKQDNKEIAELLAIAPRSVLMLRHRFRQKIGMAAENSLEDFIESMIRNQNNSSNQQL